MKKLLTILSALLFIFMSYQASARTMRLKLPYYGDHLRGHNTLYLKQKIRSEYPGINLRHAQLKKVILVAKSKQGRGRVALKVGYDIGRDYIVDGRPYDFDYPGAFHRVKMFNYGESRGVWQLKLKGNFKIKKVVVVIDSYVPERRRVTKSCQVELVSRFGRRHIKDFYAQATGIEGSGVRQRACHKAMNKCQYFKDNFGDIGAFGRCRQR